MSYRRHWAILGLLASIAAWGAFAWSREGGAAPANERLRSCVDYQADTCVCGPAVPEGHECRPRAGGDTCAACTGGDQCACIQAARQGTGTIVGRVDSPWVRKLEAAVYVEAWEGADYLPPVRHAVMDQKNLVFIPHLQTILAGTVVDFRNNDSVRHNVFSPSSAHPFDLGLVDPGVAVSETFDTAGEVALLCHPHAEMSAFLVVTPTPFHVVTDRKGAFRIINVPAGARKVTVWHEKMRLLTREVAVAAGQEVEVIFDGLVKR